MRWPTARDPASSAIAAGRLRRLGTPACMSVRVAHSQNTTTIGAAATPLVSGNGFLIGGQETRFRLAQWTETATSSPASASATTIGFGRR